MKFKFILLLFIFLIINIKAQTELKLNTVFLPVGIINLAVEHQLGDHFSFQQEIFVSPWRSFAGKNLQIYIETSEVRYYFPEAMTKWFIGGYFAVANYNLQKWNYWNVRTITQEDGTPEYLEDGSIRKTEVYQKGYSFIFGISGGYHFVLNSHYGLEIFIGIGNSQGLYRGFLKDNNERVDGAVRWNKSGEILPTRGGLMLTYKL